MAIVDPTLAAALVGAGYDRDFGQLADSDEAPGSARSGRAGCVRTGRRWVRRPAGVELDLNGVVKGKTVDEALDWLLRPPAIASSRGNG